MTDLQQLGKELRAELGDPPSSFGDRQRLRLRGLDVTPPVRTRAPLLLAALACCSLVAAGAYVWSSRVEHPSDSHTQPLAAAVESAIPEGTSTAIWVEATTTPATHRLTDGSSISLEVGGRGRLDRGEDLGTRFDLHEGTASFDVQKQGSRSFSVVAGEYRVVVVGTRFTTAYVPPRELRVVVNEGVVQVHSPSRSEPLRVNAGETLELDGDEFTLSKNPPGAAEHDEQGHGSAEKSSPPRATSWQALYREGKYQEACQATRTVPLTTLQSRLGAAALIDLSSTLRLCNDTSGSMSTLGALRSRYPSAPEAHDALFLMARILATSGQSRAAIARLDEYLAQGSGGRFAAEALGRLIELHQAVGNPDQAQRAAQRYLQLAPQGPYRRLAESVTK